MPYKVEYRPSKKRPGEPWVIVRENGTIAGRSKTKRDAQASARARLAAEHNPRFNRDISDTPPQEPTPKEGTDGPQDTSVSEEPGDTKQQPPETTPAGVRRYPNTQTLGVLGRL